LTHRPSKRTTRAGLGTRKKVRIQLKQGLESLQKMALSNEPTLKEKKFTIGLVLDGKVKLESVRVDTQRLRVVYSSNRENLEFWRCSWLTQLAIIGMCLSDWYKLPVTVFFDEYGDIKYRKGGSRKIYIHINSTLG
jgi:hypothetical protein